MGQLIPPGLRNKSITTTSPGPAPEKIFDDRIAQLLNNRRFCFIPIETAFFEGKGYRVAIAIEGEPGYFPMGTTPEGGDIEPWFWGNTIEEARAIADRENKERLGLEAIDAWKIVASTMGASPRTTASQRRHAARAKQVTKTMRSKKAKR